MLTLEQLVKEVQHRKNWRIEDVATSIGYTRPHLSREMRKDNREIAELILSKHTDILHDVIKPVYDTDISTKDRIILQLVESNKKLVDNTVDLTQMAKENWSKKHAAESIVQDTQIDGLTVLQLLAHVASHGRFRSEREALESITGKMKIIAQSIDGEIAALHNDAAKSVDKSISKRHSTNKLHKQD